jgi:hypothetical protein
MPIKPNPLVHISIDVIENKDNSSLAAGAEGSDCSTTDKPTAPGAHEFFLPLD